MDAASALGALTEVVGAKCSRGRKSLPMRSGFDLISVGSLPFWVATAMEQADWKEVVLQSLEQRDARELVSADIYDACNCLGTLQCADLQTSNSRMHMRRYDSTDHPESPSQLAARFRTPHFQRLMSRDEQGTLKAQVAELYKAQNVHLQTIKSLEARFASVEEAEQRLKQEFHSQTDFSRD